MKISAQLVKELRDKTSAGILDCRKALSENSGDLEKSIKWLREKGISKASQKADRIASEGITNIAFKKNIAVIFEVNTETDFVAKNKKFQKLIDIISDALLSNLNLKTVDEALNIEVKKNTLGSLINEHISVIGEKISLRRFKIIELLSNQTFGSYIHNQRTAALVTFEGKANSTIGKQICMHIAAMAPKFISSNDVSPSFINQEKEILIKKALSEGKPKNIVDKMVEGRLKKSLSEICLLDQSFVVQPDLKVSQVLNNENLKIINMIRYEVGEGIEKVNEDFATEVMKQIKK